MIINCPVYFEVDEKFAPAEGREFVLGFRKFFRDYLATSSGGKFKVRHDNGRIYTIKILSEKQAVDRFGAKVTKVNPQTNEDAEPKSFL